MDKHFEAVQDTIQFAAVLPVHTTDKLGTVSLSKTPPAQLARILGEVEGDTRTLVGCSTQGLHQLARIFLVGVVHSEDRLVSPATSPKGRVRVAYQFGAVTS